LSYILGKAGGGGIGHLRESENQNWPVVCFCPKKKKVKKKTNVPFQKDTGGPRKDDTALNTQFWLVGIPKKGNDPGLHKPRMSVPGIEREKGKLETTLYDGTPRIMRSCEQKKENLQEK